MSIWTHITGRTEKVEAKDFGLASPELLSLFGGVTTASGITIGETQVMTDPTASAAVKLLCGVMLTTPLHFYAKAEDGERERAADHIAEKLVAKRANGWTAAGALRAQLLYDAIHHGRGYAVAIKVRGVPREILHLAHGSVTRKVDDRSGEPSYEVRLKAGGSRTYGYRDIIDVAPWLGRAPAVDARESLARAAAMSAHAARLFRNGAKPSGVLKLPGRLTALAAERIASAWNSGFGGENSGKTAILEEGAAFESITMTSVDAQFQESFKSVQEDVARHFGVPLTLLNHLDRAVWRNPEQLATQFLQYSAAPIFECFAAAFERVLLTDDEQDSMFAEFTVDAIVKADIAARFEAYAKAISSRFMTPNEVRQRENLPAHPDGNRLENPNTTSPGVPASPTAEADDV